MTCLIFIVFFLSVFLHLFVIVNVETCASLGRGPFLWKSPQRNTQIHLTNVVLGCIFPCPLEGGVVTHAFLFHLFFVKLSVIVYVMTPASLPHYWDFYMFSLVHPEGGVITSILVSLILSIIINVKTRANRGRGSLLLNSSRGNFKTLHQ